MIINKSAEEMFRELGYKRASIGCAIVYTHNETMSSISFYFQNKEVTLQHYLQEDEIEFKRGCYLLNNAELKAIAVQLYELGWL